jgi:hypothetical protein
MNPSNSHFGIFLNGFVLLEAESFIRLHAFDQKPVLEEAKITGLIRVFDLLELSKLSPELTQIV